MQEDAVKIRIAQAFVVATTSHLDCPGEPEPESIGAPVPRMSMRISPDLDPQATTRVDVTRND